MRIIKESVLKKRFKLETYNVEKKLEFSGIEAVPWAIRMGNRILNRGGLLGVVGSMIIIFLGWVRK